jgi:hypothetical protein
MNRTEPGNQRWAAGCVSARTAESTSQCGDQAPRDRLDQAHSGPSRHKRARNGGYFSSLTGQMHLV